MTTTIVEESQRQTIAGWYGPLGPHAVELTDEVIVPMDDGVELSGILAFPKGADKVPAVLMRTPYNPASFPAEAAAFYMGEVITWASHGYACFLQTTRTSTSYFDEAADGSATVRWVEQQPWFDGRLGLNGGSYHAFTSLATASTRPASLKAIATEVYSSDRVSSWYPGGGFGLELALSWTAIQQASGAAVGENPYDHLPLNEADAVATGTTLDFYQERLAYDGDDQHWQPLNFAELLDDPPAPILHIDGWYDYHRTYFWQDFERLNRNTSNVPHRLVIGPWPHATLDPRITMAEKLAWFDNYVRGNGTARFGTLRYYNTGADAFWHEIEKWDEPESTVFYANSGDQLLTTPNDGVERVQWTYDPADATPSVEMITIGHSDVSGLWDNSSLEQRSDVRVFTSAPLHGPLDLAGRASATATLYSDAPSADLYLRILDVYDNGQVQSVADGILRVTDRGLPEGIPVEIDLGPVGHRFGVGHRIRLLVASGAHPYHNRNLGDGEPIATASRIRVAHQAVTAGGENGLRIYLPLAP
jgi:putative CocE/NonD family hydrolase